MKPKLPDNLPTPTWQDKEYGIALYRGDCLDVMPGLPKVDCVLTDPPYGIGMDGGNVGYKGFNDFEKLDWDNNAPDYYTILLVRGCADRSIIWGGNYFNLPESRCWLIWDKGEGFYNRTYAEAELAWTNLDANTRIKKHDPLAMRDYVGKQHPTQKPVAVMEWCLSFIPDATCILDPFAGSGTTGVACVNLDRAFIGIEKEPKYFDIAVDRISQAIIDKQDGPLFATHVPGQGELDI